AWRNDQACRIEDMLGGTGQKSNRHNISLADRHIRPIWRAARAIDDEPVGDEQVVHGRASMLYWAVLSKLSTSRCAAGDAQSRYPKPPANTCPSRSMSNVVGVAGTANIDATFASVSSRCGKVKRCLVT